MVRQYIDLVETTLYRGDATQIDQFDSAKTGFLALFGAGIYLTDNPTVAADYTLKSSDHVLMRGESARDVIMTYLATIVRDKFAWKQFRENLLTKWREALYADPDHRAASGRPYDWDKVREVSKRYEAGMNKERLDTLSKFLKKAKVIFKQQAPELRLIQDTTGEWALVKKDRDAYVSRFEIPEAYLAKTFNADQPMPDKVLATIKHLFLSHLAGVGYGGDPKIDMRDDNGEFQTFDGWVQAYKTRGIMYAWAAKDDEVFDPVVKGNGKNPSFDIVRNGTHFGGSWFHDRGNMAKFIAAMEKIGYVGLEYDGGVRVGSHLRGGGGIRHRAFVFWHDDDINRFKVDVQRVSANDTEIETKIANSIRTSAILYPLGQMSG